MDSKACTKCGVVKLLGEYRPSKDGAGGISSECKDCLRDRGRAWKQLNREKVLASKTAARRRAGAKSKSQYLAAVSKYEAHVRDYHRFQRQVLRSVHDAHVRHWKRVVGGRRRDPAKSARRRTSLSKQYVAKLLRADGFPHTPPDLIALKREELFIHRALRELTEIQNGK